MNVLMQIMRAQGLQALHIVEADKPGPADVLVWSGSEIMGWVECKVDDRAVEVSQREFLRERDAESGLAFVFRLSQDEALIRIYKGDNRLWNKLSVIDVIHDPDKINWRLWFWKHRNEATRYR